MNLYTTLFVWLFHQNKINAQAVKQILNECDITILQLHNLFIFYLLKIDVDFQSASARKVHHKKLIEGSILKYKNNLPKHL
jgi:hypothetical protein